MKVRNRKNGTKDVPRAHLEICPAFIVGTFKKERIAYFNPRSARTLGFCSSTASKL
jgi:hypothetical protein